MSYLDDGYSFNLPPGEFFCRYCHKVIEYEALFETIREKRKAKIEHFGRVHRRYIPKRWRQHFCEKCDSEFPSRHQLKKHKYEVHGY